MGTSPHLNTAHVKSEAKVDAEKMSIKIITSFSFSQESQKN